MPLTPAETWVMTEPQQVIRPQLRMKDIAPNEMETMMDDDEYVRVENAALYMIRDVVRMPEQAGPGGHLAIVLIAKTSTEMNNGLPEECGPAEDTNM
jgi:hypothetical protein